MTCMKYILFVGLLAGVSMWLQISLFVSGIGQNQAPFTPHQDSDLTKMIQAKTGVNLSTFYLSDSKQLFGMMSGIPGHPTLLLSEALYSTFSEDELQFVVLHEMGHYVQMHTAKETLLGIILVTLGILILKKQRQVKKTLLVSIILGAVFGLILLQYGKFNEYEADHYAITKMDDPQGAIDAAYRFKEAYSHPDRDSSIHMLFYRRIPYYERINTAEIEIANRNKTK